LEKVAEIEGVDSLAVVAGGGREVKGVIDEASGPSLFCRLPQHGRILRDAERSDMEVGQNVLRE
jgi:hypothetical protein